MSDDNTTLKMLLYEFNDEANTLLRAKYLDLDDAVARFLDYVEGEPVIKAFLDDCVQNSLPQGFDANAEVDAVCKDVGTIFGGFAHDYKGESAEVYLILKSLTDRNMWSSGFLLYGYGQGSRKFNDMTKDFLNDVARRLINGIERHLKLIGIQRGLSDMTYLHQEITTGDNSPVNASQSADHSTAEAVQTNNGVDAAALSELMDGLTATIAKLSENERAQANELVEALKEEFAKKKPKRSVLNAILGGLKLISVLPEFVQAVGTLQQFVASLPPAA